MDRFSWAFAAIATLISTSAFAQRFEGYQSAQSVVASSSLSSPYQVAVDGNQNVYIADAGNNRVLMEAPSAGGYSETTIPSSALNGPEGVAVDASGNVYIADSGNGRVLKETLSAGSYTENVVSASAGQRRPIYLAVDRNGVVYVADAGYGSVWVETPTATGGYTETSILWSAYGMGDPEAVAVDGSGDVFVASSGTSPILKGTPSSSGYTVTAISVQYLGTSFSAFGLAVDREGNLFVSDDSANRVIEEIPVSSNYTQTTVDMNLGSPIGLAVDSNENLYVVDSKNNRVVIDTLNQGNFGTVDVSTTAMPISLIFSYEGSAPGNMGNPAVLMQGNSGLDFEDAGTGSCTVNGSSYVYVYGQSCTVNVSFSPKFAGARYGAAVLQDSSGAAVARAYVQGTGLGPQLNFPPGSQNQLLLSGVNAPSAITVDGDGNLYIAEAAKAYDPGNAVVKETWASSGYTESSVAPGLAYPVGVAVDGAGNVFIADQDASAIVEASPSANGYRVTTVLPGMGNVEGVAVDGLGNLYITSNAFGVLKETYVSSTETYTQSTIARGVFGYGIAVDGQGNVYIADSSAGQIYLETPSNGAYTQTTIASNLDLRGIAVDENGNLFVSTQGGILKETLTGTGYVQGNVISGINGYVLGSAVDSSGNVYAASIQGNGIWEADLADAPTLSFAATAFGQTSSDSPKTVTLQNVGNTALEMPIPSAGTNPSISAGFEINGGAAQACPSIGASSTSPGTLAVAASCELSVSFSPIATGTNNGTIAFTYSAPNALASEYVTRNIPLTSTGSQATPTGLLTSSANPSFLSNAVILNAAFSSAAGTPTGTVSFYDGTTLLGQTTLSSGAASYRTSTLSAGQHSISASYEGDTNFAPITTAVLVETIEDFTFAPQGGGTLSATAAPGGSAVYTLPFAPADGSKFPAAISFALAGLPSGAAASFSPSTIQAGAGPTNVTLTIAISNQFTARSRIWPSLALRSPLMFAMILLPFGTRRRKYRICSTVIRNRLVGFGIAITLLTAGLTGCGGSSNPKATVQPQTYTLSITATSGSLSHTATVTLIVE